MMPPQSLRIKLRKNQSTLPMEKIHSDISHLEILGDTLEKIPDLNHLSNCQSLQIICPQLIDLGELPPTLEVLKIKGGHTLPKTLPRGLRILQIAKIKGQSFDDLRLPQTIQTLDLSGNGLVTLHKDIGSLKYLTRLSLDQNELTELPDELYAHRGLNHLSLDGNKLTDEVKDRIYKVFGIWF